MNRLGYISALVLLLAGLTAAGQGFRDGTERYERIRKDNLWNSSRNVTGVRQDSISRSFAELYGSFRKGGFRDTWEAPEGWSAGAVTSSIRHLEKISFTGSFSFDQTEGYGMCGSMFIKPGLHPVDVLEFTPGRKTLQTYSFDGGLSYDASPSWRIGAEMDFEASNIAKRKDLRHTNKRLEMTVAPGFMYHSGDFAIGAAYIFGKTSETIEAEQVGTSESSYLAFLDKGMMYGVHSVWTGSGIHLQESGVNGFPVNDFSNGIAVQMQYRGLFAELEYLNTRGRIGEKEYIWFTYPGNGAGVLLGYSQTGMKARHNALVRFGWKNLGLDENILEKVTENGVNTVLCHGSNRILSQETISLSPEYELIAKRLELTARAEMRWMKSMGSQMYPYAYSQSLGMWEASADVLVHLGAFDLGAVFAFGKGSVHENESVSDGDSGPLSKPFRLEEWYDRQMEYRTSGRLEAGLSLRWNFRKGLYIEAAGEWMHGFDIQYISGSDRLGASLKFGYNF